MWTAPDQRRQLPRPEGFYALGKVGVSLELFGLGAARRLEQFLRK